MFISTKLSSLLLIISQVSLSSQDETTEACGDLALESIPSKYATNMMMIFINKHYATGAMLADSQIWFIIDDHGLLRK